MSSLVTQLSRGFQRPVFCHSAVLHSRSSQPDMSISNPLVEYASEMYLRAARRRRRQQRILGLPGGNVIIEMVVIPEPKVLRSK